MKSGFVSLIGRPNAGKSTLLNSIIGSKLAITSSKAQTTRDNIRGIYNEEDTQIVFVDTPGIHKPKHKLGQYLNREAYYTIDDVDIVLLLIDAKEKWGKGDDFVLERLKKVDKPVFLIINKIDTIPRENILSLIASYKDLYPFAEIVPVSALKKDNVSELIGAIKPYLKDEVQYYPEEDITDQSEAFRMKEMIREKILHLTEEEVPHAATCIIESIKQDKNGYHIGAVIVVDRNSQKGIIVGKNGAKIKQIGTLARRDIETMLGKKIYLELFVKVIKDWRNKERQLMELGYSEKEL
ncbi:MAG: GTPase Era [Bacilli bacterium]|nr:GTPase Era [Bacilli bacterium]